MAYIVRQPSLQVVNSVGAIIEGPFPLVVSGGAPSQLGLTYETIDAAEEAVEKVWVNYQWQQVGFLLGYRLHAVIKFSDIDVDTSSNTYGLTLLHRLWQIAKGAQLTYGALQFRMFAGDAYRPVVATGSEWHPGILGGKQATGHFDGELSIATRNLVAAPGEWAKGSW